MQIKLSKNYCMETNFNFEKLSFKQDFLFDKKIISPQVVEQFVKDQLLKKGKDISVEKCALLLFKVCDEHEDFFQKVNLINCFFVDYTLTWVLEATIDNVLYVVTYSMQDSSMYLFFDIEKKLNPMEMGIFEQKRISWWKKRFGSVSWLFKTKNFEWRCPGGCCFDIHRRHSRKFKLSEDGLTAVQDIRKTYRKHVSETNFSFLREEKLSAMELTE